MKVDEKKTMFICPKCGPFVRVYKEKWTIDSEGPYKIEFVQHIDGGAVVVDEVSIKPKPDGEQLTYAFCGQCKRLIDREKSCEWLDQKSLPF